MGTPNSAKPMLAGHENSVQRQLADRRTRCTASAPASDSIRWVHATLHSKARLAVRGLLGLAVRGDPAVAHGFAAARDALNQIDPKLPSAVVRCAFNGVIRPRIRYYDPQPDDEARRVDAVARAKRVVDSEVASLCGKADEPQWPRFPESHARPRERLYIMPRELPKEPNPVKLVEPIYVDHRHRQSTRATPPRVRRRNEITRPGCVLPT